MKFLILASSSGGLADAVLLISLIAVGVLLGAATLVSGILRLIILINYWTANRRRCAGGCTGASAAQTILALYGLENVQVKKAGFFAALLYGNHYNPNRKTVYLTSRVFHGNNVTAVALGAEKAELARADLMDGKAVRSRWRLQKVAIFGPVLFVPIALIGLIVDAVMGFTGIPFLIGAGVALAFFLCCFVLSALTIPVESRASKKAIEALSHTDLLTEEERGAAAKVLKTYVIAYVTDFIVALLEIIRLILRILASATSRKGK